MLKRILAPLCALMLCGGAHQASSLDLNSSNDVAEILFGGHVLHSRCCVEPRDLTPWPPQVTYVSRMWDTDMTWADINTADGKYNWSGTGFDAYVAAAAASNTQLIYTIAKTPAWASSNPTDRQCTVGGWLPGQCDPPSRNSYWTTFITKVVNRAAGRIKYWECWNEPNNPWEWNSTQTNMVALCQLAYQTIKNIDPTLIVLTPAVGDPGWMTGYMAAGGGKYADVMTMHAYPKNAKKPEAEVAVQHAAQFSSIAAAYMGPNIPLWDTESSWGGDNITDPTLQAAFAAKYYLIGYGAKIERRYWHAYDLNSRHSAALWHNPSIAPTGIATLTSAGVAVQQVQKWMIGAKPLAPVQRQAGANTIRNPAMSGVAVGGSSTLPTHWSISGDFASAGLIGNVIALGDDAAGPYLDYRLNGTYTGDVPGAVRIQFDQNQIISALRGQLWTATCRYKLNAGSAANVTFSLGSIYTNSTGSYTGHFVDSFYPNSAVQTVTAWGTAPDNTAFIYPELAMQYNPGAVIDITLRIYAPTLDRSAVWSGTFARPKGYQGQVVWDQSGPSMYTVPVWAKQSRDLTGAVTVGIGAAVPINEVPILLETGSAW
jgi:polysaccharide biosynthesis protein PslG